LIDRIRAAGRSIIEYIKAEALVGRQGRGDRPTRARDTRHRAGGGCA